jgi:phage terminase large subunit-like protein
MSNYELGRLAAEIEAATVRAQRERRLDFWRPYPKQAQFHAAGKRCREKAMFAGTQLGKTECAAAELAYHLTGLYPVDWDGRRWDRPVRAWAVGESTKMTRDIQQRKLLGEAGDVNAFGTGMIPKHLIIEDQIVYSHGEKHAIDTVHIRHVSGGVSVLKFRSYQQGRESLQGESLDVVWADEEPPMDIYSELLGRISGTGGMILTTFTPLKGMSDVCLRFLNEFDPGRTYVKFGINDLPDDAHISPADRAAIIASYPEHEREARANGTPMLGTGRIYMAPENDLIEDADPREWPPHWTWCWGIDIGVNHPAAGVLMAFDTDQKVHHVVAEMRASNLTIGEHVNAMRQIEKRIFNRHMDFVVAWPHDAGTRDRGSGQYLRDMYKEAGLRMMHEHSQMLMKDGSKNNSLEGSIQAIITAERNGKWRIARSCILYVEERRLFHRDAHGEVVKLRDDVLSAARYAMMMQRFWKPLYESGLEEIPGHWPSRSGSWWGGRAATPSMARDVDFDLS